MPTATAAEIVDTAAYSNYRYNRQQFNILPEDWYLMYSKEMVDRMERRYQEERHTNVHAEEMSGDEADWIKAVDRMERKYQKEIANDPRNV